MFQARNRVAHFVARLGMEVYNHLCTLDHPVGVVENLLDWDLGLGFDHPDFQDIIIPNHAPYLLTSM